ncbi:MAG: cytochrome c oxidase subunit II [Pseudobdellovibrionaceae bacterium]|nr:cytochrome c oxidase subunit II [Pseudobdellovibrionaceae bacterium]
MTHKLTSFFGLFIIFAALVLSAGSALAAPDFSQILSWPRGLQDPATPTMEHITNFHDMLLYIITAIVIFVTGLLLYVIIRFNAKANPVPSTTTHNVMLEVLWTVVPVVILIVIAVPSFKLLFFEARNPDPELTVKVIGHQWNWEYEYPDYGDVSFTSNIIDAKDIDPSKGQKRLLSTDTPVVLPVDTNIVFEVTASDVIHSFAVPAFGIKVDAVPGRLNSTWARVTKTGTYYGQCSEICGKGHGFMPIEIKVVDKAEFEDWIKSQGGTVPEKTEIEAAIPAPVASTDSEEVPVDLPVPAKSAE